MTLPIISLNNPNLKTSHKCTLKKTLNQPSLPESSEFITQITNSQRQLHAFILSLVWNPAEADDVLQETNLVLWQKADLYDNTRPFLPWAMRFAQFQASAWLKRHRRHKERYVVDNEILMLLAEETVTDEPELDSRKQALAKGLQKLKPKQREWIEQRYQPNTSVKEMAATEGISPKAASDRLRRIRHTLLGYIEKILDTENRKIANSNESTNNHSLESENSDSNCEFNQLALC